MEAWQRSTAPRRFWLDGGGAREWSGRRSILGVLEHDDVSLTYSAARREVTRHASGSSEVVGDDVFEVLSRELELGGPRDQWFGYLGYACRPDLPARPSPDVPDGVPDAVWMRPSRVRLVEHAGPDSPPGWRNRRLSTEVPAGRRQFHHPGGETAAVPPDYRAAFDRVQERLHAGDTYEVNLTHRLEVASDLDPLAAYLRLRELNPAPYAGFLQHDVPGARAWLLSSSPERYATVSTGSTTGEGGSTTGEGGSTTGEGGRVLETKPIKGTTPRSEDPAEDDEHRRRLAQDEKYRAENLMIVDLLRHDVASVCEPGSVEVPQLMEVESYSSVHQLVSTVRGRLRADVGTVEALRALFPAGSMTGAPKLRTMEVIDEVEATPRGVYAGAFGWVSGDGRADLGVVIRSLVTAGDGRYVLGTGGGITVLSDPVEEHAEAMLKAVRLLEALGTDGDS
nr:anthranilate synthase component I family protein [Nocardioides marinus]